jgi:hypothetical protein
MIIFRSEDKETAESFAKRDPHVLNGLVKAWRVRPWSVAVGGELRNTTVSLSRDKR